MFKPDPSEEDNALILSSAVAIAYIIVQYNLPCNKATGQILCHGLLLRLDNAGTCKAYETLTNYHFRSKE